MTVFPREAYRMRDLDEVRGDLQHIEEAGGGVLALIGKIPVILPPELEPHLREMVGRKCAILRLDGKYHVRDLEAEDAAR
ncbi:MAG: hypothetical protein A4E48_00449 [Methanosaeta sp. PtaU1.Bin060]|nr:MAG: hypothetical protein A4E48_00449 [Methanosaeta sp. PtaU1.Bin060]